MASKESGFAGLVAGMGAGMDPDPADDSDGSSIGPSLVMTEEEMVLEQVAVLDNQLETSVARLSIDNETKRTKLSVLQNEQQSWSASGAATEKEEHSEEYYKDQFVKKILIKQLEARIGDDYLVKKAARYPPNTNRVPLHCGHLRAVLNVTKQMTFEDLHAEVSSMWLLPHDRFRLVVCISHNFRNWQQFEYSPSDKVQASLLTLGKTKELGYGNFGILRRTPTFLPPVFMVYQPFQAHLTSIVRRPARMERIFRRHDESHTGYLNLIEFRTAVSLVLGLSVTPRFARLVYRSYADHRGIDLAHFSAVVHYWDSIKTAISDDFEDTLSAEDAFAMLGKDRYSTLDAGEFLTVVRMLFPKMKKKRARTLFAEVDDDQGGTISLGELKAYWPTLLVECARLRAAAEEEKERAKKAELENRFATSLPGSARIAVKEMAMYFVLLFLFLFAMGSRRSVRDQYNYVDSLSLELRSARFGPANELVWEEVKSEVDWWRFVKGPFATTAYRTMDKSDPFSANRVVSPLRIQSYRTASKDGEEDCTGPDPTQPCLQRYDNSEGTELTAPYGIGGRHTYDPGVYTTLRCNVSEYDGSGYTHNYVMDGTALHNFTAYVDTQLMPDFVDKHVAAVVASATYFNLNYNLYAEFNFVMERAPAGVWLPTTRIYPMRMDMYSNNSDRVIAVFEAICCVLAMAVIALTLQRVGTELAIRRALDKVGALADRHKTVPITVFAIMDVVAALVVLASQVVRLYHFGLNSRRDLTVNYGPERSKEVPVNMAFQWLLYSIPYRLDAIVVAFFGVRLLRHTAMFQSTLIYARFFGDALEALFAATVGFFFVTSAYAALTWVWLSTELGSLVRPDMAFNRITEMMYGRYAFRNIEEVGNWQDAATADVVAFFFLFTVSTISVNYFLALIRDVYSQQYQHMIVHPERFKVEAELTLRNVGEVFFPALFKSDEDAELEEMDKKTTTKQGLAMDGGGMNFDEEAVERRVEQQFAFEDDGKR